MPAELFVWHHLPGAVLRERIAMKPQWERQKGEHTRAYAAFEIYRKLGPTRTLEQTAITLGKAVKQLYNWSAVYEWRERALAWDTELARQVHLEEIEAVKEMAKRHADVALQLLAKGLERLSRLDVDELSAGDTLKYIAEAVRLERQARGEPETVIEHATSEHAAKFAETQALMLSDDEAIDHACKFLERIANASENPRRIGIVRNGSGVAIPTAPRLIEPPPASNGAGQN